MDISIRGIRHRDLGSFATIVDPLESLNEFQDSINLRLSHLTGPFHSITDKYLDVPCGGYSF
jgi:hypothetical protein